MAQRSSLAYLLVMAILAAVLNTLLPSSPFVNGSPALRAQLRSRVLLRAASEETMKKTVDIIAEQLGVEKAKVVPTATLTELGADSLDIVEAVMALEESFDVELPDEETTKLKTVQDAADLIQSKL